jgi:hypothetical protein
MMLRLCCLLAVTSLAGTVAGCRTPPALRNCGDDLSGQWLLPGEAGRWALHDSAARIDGFPLRPDQQVSPDGVIGAPRWLELVRDHDVIAGRIHRRYMRRAQRCEATGTLRILACHDQVMEVERSALPAPSNLQPCVWSPNQSITQELWQRVSL